MNLVCPTGIRVDRRVRSQSGLPFGERRVSLDRGETRSTAIGDEIHQTARDVLAKGSLN